MVPTALCEMAKMVKWNLFLRLRKMSPPGPLTLPALFIADVCRE